MEADFSGYATKAGVKCSDGRTIAPSAFKHMDKMTVPLVWQHGHNNVENVLGHVVLEARNDGIYAHGYFNPTKQGQSAKLLVQHKDVKSLSIYANQLKEKNQLVQHGTIREVSLVLSGANPEATIDFVRLSHGDGTYDDLEDEAVISLHLNLEIQHSDDVEEIEIDEEVFAHAAAATEETVQDVFDTLNDKQKNVVQYMIAVALQSVKNTASKAEHSDTNEGDSTHQEGSQDMNVFEEAANGATTAPARKYLSHDDVRGIVQDAIKNNGGSLKAAVEAYAFKHGIDNIDVLFPDAQSIENMPQFNKRRTEWVTGVLSDTRHSPFSRVKTIVADITQAEARAKGYIKGNYKIEEWFGVTKRVTTPTTIYKKQKLDRDDVVDITDFDVVAWVKQEMRIMLDEELARAVLLGDGRDVADDDKIKDPMGQAAGDGIRSILYDHELFVTTLMVNVDDASSSYDEVVDAVMDGMEYYKGTGTPTFYTTIRQLNKFLKAKDGMNRRLYNNKSEVAAALGVDRIVTVEPMNDYTDVIGIIVNLDDYTLGADKGGEVSTFEDFDIDYNQQKYLIETRLSGGLTRIKSAIVIKSTGASDTVLAEPTAPTYDKVTHVVTIPTVTHVTYKNADTGATLSAGDQAALAVGATLNVQATANTGYFFANDANTIWPFFRRV
jgi:HK97 family phage prohead protease